MNRNKTLDLEIYVSENLNKGNEMGEWVFVSQPVRKCKRDEYSGEFLAQIKDDTSDSLKPNFFTTESCDLMEYEEDYFARPIQVEEEEDEGSLSTFCTKSTISLFKETYF